MSCAPVILFCYNRPDVLRNTLEALAKNHLAAETELYIFSDGPKPYIPSDSARIAEVRELLHQQRDAANFSAFYIDEQENNRGLAASIIAGVSEVAKRHESFIVLEDEMLAAPNLLDYMNAALHYYQNEERVWCINGMAFNPKFLELPQDYVYDTYFLYRNSSYCWASWPRHWQKAVWDEEQIRMELIDPKRRERFQRGGSDMFPMMLDQIGRKIDSWAIRWSYSISREDGLCLTPRYSYVQPQQSVHGGSHIATLPPREHIDISLAAKQDMQNYPPELKVKRQIASRFALCFRPELPAMLVDDQSESIRNPDMKETSSPRISKTTKRKVAHLVGVERGGAFLAAQGLSDKLCDLGYQSDVITPSWDKGSVRHQQRAQMNQVLESYIEGQKYPELVFHTTFGGYLSFGELRSLVAEYDIIHLHWLHNFVSAEGVAYLTHLCAEQGKALFYTSHDMKLYSGACHYFHGCERWLEGCNTCPQYLRRRWNDIPNKILAAKKKYWKLNALTIVSPSKYLAQTVAQKSFLLQDWGYGCSRIEVVPNSIDTELFRPQNQSDARKRLRHLGLPQDGKLIAFLPSYVSSCKGLAEARMVYDLLQQEKTGQAYYWAITAPAHSAFIGAGENIYRIPFLRERTECVLLYAAADVVLVPSLEETFSLTTAEALACARPVVGFHISGLADMIENGFNGYTVPLGDACAMAEAVQKILEGEYLGDNCRHYAEQNLSRKTQVAAMDTLYREVYQQAQTKQAVAQEQAESYKIPEIFPELIPRYLELYHEAVQVWTKDHFDLKLQQDHHKLQHHRELQQNYHKLQQDRWYRFGHLSRKRKLWVMGKALCKKLGIYRLLQPVAKQIKPVLRKRK